MRLLSREEFLEMPPYTFYVEQHSGTLRMKMKSFGDDDMTSIATNKHHGGFEARQLMRSAGASFPMDTEECIHFSGGEVIVYELGDLLQLQHLIDIAVGVLTPPKKDSTPEDRKARAKFLWEYLRKQMDAE